MSAGGRSECLRGKEIQALQGAQVSTFVIPQNQMETKAFLLQPN